LDLLKTPWQECAHVACEINIRPVMSLLLLGCWFTSPGFQIPTNTIILGSLQLLLRCASVSDSVSNGVFWYAPNLDCIADFKESRVILMLLSYKRCM
jgi:hypothetical protein